MKSTSPKQPKVHFDVAALLGQVQQQDIGLRVSTNNPAGFKRILYAAMRAAPHLKARLYQDPRSRSAFLLTKQPIPSASELGEEMIDD